MKLTEVRHATPDGGEGLLAIVIACDSADAPFSAAARFVTDDKQGLQVGVLRFASDHIVPAHHHVGHERKTVGTQEVLFVRRGWVELSVYTSQRELVQTVTLGPNDVAVLLAGGHSLKCLSTVEIVEVKQGPYMGAEDKVRW